MEQVPLLNEEHTAVLRHSLEYWIRHKNATD